MKIVIIEDEKSASNNLIYLLNQIDSDIKVVKVLDSVASAVRYLQRHNDYELILTDIHLGDGKSFEIFEQIEIIAPIIFTTAYDQYALQAFKVNSIDYLLKPIQQEELRNAIIKYQKNKFEIGILRKQANEFLKDWKNKRNKHYTSVLLVKRKETLIPIEAKEFACFFIQEGIVRGILFSEETFVMDQKMEDLENILDPKMFYRVNRQYILNRKVIKKMDHYFGGRIVITTQLKTEDPIIVSKAKVREFKDWLIHF